MKSSAIQRRQQLLKQLTNGAIYTPAQLAEQLGVSIMTIYRDLKVLQAQGVVHKESGGIFKAQANPHHAFSSFVPISHQTAKTAIGRFAAAHLIDEQKDSLIIDSGTTVLEFVKALPDVSIQVMVDSLPALNALSTYQHMQVHVIGGKLNIDNGIFEGSLAHDTLSNCHFTKAFIGTDGIDLRAGLTTTNTANAQLTRLMAEQADEVYILADLSKFYQRALASIMGFERITAIITQQGVSDEFKELFLNKNIKLFEVDCYK